jgi:hypothetical protein
LPANPETLVRRPARNRSAQHDNNGCAGEAVGLLDVRPAKEQTMSDFLLLLVINALLISGIYTATAPDMLLNSPREWFANRFPRFAKCVCDCPPCMSSLWGAPFFMAFNEPSSLNNILRCVLHVICLCGLMRLLAPMLNDAKGIDNSGESN